MSNENESCRGRLRLGLIVAPPGQQIEKQVLDFCIYVAEFPKVEKIAKATGKRSLGRHKLLAELLSCKRTLTVDTARFFGKSKELRWCGPGQDGFPRNGDLLYWLNQQVREKAAAPFGKHERHLVFLLTLPPLPSWITIDNFNLTGVLYSAGRIIEQYADFVAIYRNGQLDFLKNRSGHTFPEVSWKI